MAAAEINVNPPKTAALILQEFLATKGKVTEYQWMIQIEPSGKRVHECYCKALDQKVKAKGKTQKEAKQAAAHNMLVCLVDLGHPVPPPYGPGNARQNVVGDIPMDYVTKLYVMCLINKINPPCYELTEEFGPTNLRFFAMKVTVGEFERRATASTKMCARQLAAGKMYNILQCLLRHAVLNPCESTQRQERCKNHGPKCSNRRFLIWMGSERAVRCVQILDANRLGNGHSSAQVIAALAEVLNFRSVYSLLHRNERSPLVVLELIVPNGPELTFCGTSQTDAENYARDYFRMVLTPKIFNGQ